MCLKKTSEDIIYPLIHLLTTVHGTLLMELEKE